MVYFMISGIKNGGWNGMMDAINDLQNIYKIKTPNFDKIPFDLDIYELIMKEI